MYIKAIQAKLEDAPILMRISEGADHCVPITSAHTTLLKSDPRMALKRQRCKDRHDRPGPEKRRVAHKVILRCFHFAKSQLEHL